MKKKEEQPRHRCGECAHGEWSDKFTNMSMDGKPFLKICPYSNFTSNAIGQRVCLRDTFACEKFKPIKQ